VLDRFGDRDILLSVRWPLWILVLTIFTLAAGAAAPAQNAAPAPPPSNDTSLATRRALTAPPGAPQLPSRQHADINTIKLLTPLKGVALSPYMTRMREQVAHTWNAAILSSSPPLPAANRAMTVTFWVTPEGRIEGAVVHEPSGIPEMDRVALKGINDASPLDPLPPMAEPQRVQFEMVFGYRLLPDSDAEMVRKMCTTAPPSKPAALALDRVDVLGLLAGGFDSEGARVMLCSRGIIFQADDEFLQTLQHYQSNAKWLDFVAGLKARPGGELAATRVKAYEILDYDPTVRDQSPNVSSNTERLAKALEIAPDSAGLQLAEARRHVIAKKYREAEASYRKAAELWPDCAEAQVGIALTALGQQRPADATSPAREALRLAPADLMAQWALAHSLVGTGKFTEAVAPFKAAQPLGAQLPITYLNYAITLLHISAFADAVEPLQNYLQTQNNSAQAHYLLGVAYRGLGKKAEAVEQFDKAGLLAPTDPKIAYARDQMNAPAEDASRAPAQAKLLDGAELNGSVYTNRFFGFSYAFPQGWHALPLDVCTKLAKSIAGLALGADPVLHDAAAVAMESSTSLLCVSRDDEREMKAGDTSIRITALDGAGSPDAFHAENIARVFAGMVGLASKNSGGPDVRAEQVTVAGRVFWKVKGQVAQGNISVRIVTATTELDGYVLMFDLDANDDETLEVVETTLQSLKFTAVRTESPH
jgi:TonB family protein